MASCKSCQKQSRNLSGIERISKKIDLKPVRFVQMRIRAKKIQKTLVKSEEILVFDLAARAVFGQIPLLEKNLFLVVSSEDFIKISLALLP